MKLGMFEEHKMPDDPLAVPEGVTLTPNPPFVAPHSVWTKVRVPCRLRVTAASKLGPFWQRTAVLARIISHDGECSCVFQFLAERVEMAKFCRQDQAEVFASMLQKSLGIHVGKGKGTMTRHGATFGCRYR